MTRIINNFFINNFILLLIVLENNYNIEINLYIYI